MAILRILPPAAKYLKEIKDKKLKSLYSLAIKNILEGPEIGKKEKGDLNGIRGYDIYYNRTNYELAYTIEYVKNTENGIDDIVVVILAGTREKFYEQLKRYWL